MQAIFETVIELADLNALCSNITLTMLSGHFLKPVTQDKMEYLIINSEITTDKLFPEQIMDTQIDDDVYQFKQRVLLSNSYKAPEIEPDLEMITPESMMNERPESPWSYERLTSLIFLAMTESEQNVVKEERLEQIRQYDNMTGHNRYTRVMNQIYDNHFPRMGIDNGMIIKISKDLETFHQIKCYRFTSTLSLNSSTE